MVPPYIGRGSPRTYPPVIAPTKPLRTLGFVSRGSICGELALCEYIGLTYW